MICPYCQSEIDVETLECPRCAAAYPRPSKPFSWRIRTAVAAGSILFVMSFMLVECVISYLPGWSKSSLPYGSAQLPLQPAPNMKSPEVNTLLQRWGANQQAIWTPPAVSRK